MYETRRKSDFDESRGKDGSFGGGFGRVIGDRTTRLEYALEPTREARGINGLDDPESIGRYAEMRTRTGKPPYSRSRNIRPTYFAGAKPAYAVDSKKTAMRAFDLMSDNGSFETASASASASTPVSQSDMTALATLKTEFDNSDYDATFVADYIRDKAVEVLSVVKNADLAPTRALTTWKAIPGWKTYITYRDTLVEFSILWVDDTNDLKGEGKAQTKTKKDNESVKKRFEEVLKSTPSRAEHTRLTTDAKRQIKKNGELIASRQSFGYALPKFEEFAKALLDDTVNYSTDELTRVSTTGYESKLDSLTAYLYPAGIRVNPKVVADAKNLARVESSPDYPSIEKFNEAINVVDENITKEPERLTWVPTEIVGLMMTADELPKNSMALDPRADRLIKTLSKFSKYAYEISAARMYDWSDDVVSTFDSRIQEISDIKSRSGMGPITAFRVLIDLMENIGADITLKERVTHAMEDVNLKSDQVKNLLKDVAIDGRLIEEKFEPNLKQKLDEIDAMLAQMQESKALVENYNNVWNDVFGSEHYANATTIRIADETLQDALRGIESFVNTMPTSSGYQQTLKRTVAGKYDALKNEYEKFVDSIGKSVRDFDPKRSNFTKVFDGDANAKASWLRTTKAIRGILPVLLKFTSETANLMVTANYDLMGSADKEWFMGDSEIRSKGTLEYIKRDAENNLSTLKSQMNYLIKPDSETVEEANLIYNAIMSSLSKSVRTIDDVFRLSQDATMLSTRHQLLNAILEELETANGPLSKRSGAKAEVEARYLESKAVEPENRLKQTYVSKEPEGLKELIDKLSRYVP